MANLPEFGPQTSRPDASGKAASPLDWSRLFRSRTPVAALEQLGAAFGGQGVRELILTVGEADEPVAAWARPADEDAGDDPVPSECVALIPGRPEWRLSARLDGDDAWAANALERVALLLEAWRSARDELERADRGLVARSRELDLVQAMGRRAAEARMPEDLFSSTVAVLQQELDLDLILAAYPLGGDREMVLYLARPFPGAYDDELVSRAARFLTWTPDAVPAPKRIELDTYEGAGAADRVFREEDVVLLPLMRKGQPIACLLVVPAAELSERDLRLLYSSSNQLSLHLDRILTVRAAEAGRFRAVVDSMPQGVVLADTDLRMRQANRSAHEMFASCDLPLYRDLDGTLERLGLGHVVQPILDGGGPVSEGEARLDDGRVWAVTASPVEGQRGGLDGLVLVFTDVTERRRLQHQLTQSEKMSSLGQMISGVAHELNNPLASILGYSQLLHGTSGDDKLQRRVRTLAQEAERCRKIVRNLLSYARQREPEWKPLSLNQVAETVLSLMAYQLRVDDVGVETRLDGALPVVHGDAHQLEQVLVNLLTNARQALKGTGRPGTVTVATRPDGSGAVGLEVTDDGPGIPEAIRHRIFDPFFTTKPPGEGTGLGLSLVYNIVSAHGGSIDVRSRPGSGTSFAIRLPLGADRRDRAHPAAGEPEPASFRSGRILVVDDEEPVAEMICEALAADGHVTQSAADGREALERIEAGAFDLVISDVRMPGMDGEQLHAELVRLRPELSGRLLLTTGDTFGPEPDEIAARTGLDVLRKPFDLLDLRRRVRGRLAVEP